MSRIARLLIGLTVAVAAGGAGCTIQQLERTPRQERTRPPVEETIEEPGQLGQPVYDEGLVLSAIHAEIRRQLSSLYSPPASLLYSSPTYSLSLESVEFSGESAHAVGSVSVSVYENQTGKTLSASGRAQADLRWDGFRWVVTGYRLIEGTTNT